MPSWPIFEQPSAPASKNFGSSSSSNHVIQEKIKIVHGFKIIKDINNHNRGLFEPTPYNQQ
jgi:hypothetical protein